nr:sodium:proton antiporter [Hyphomicrobium zavarzinii]
FEAGQAIEQGRAANAAMPIIGRAQTEAEADYLRSYGATHVIIGADTLADALLATYRATASEQPPPPASPEPPPEPKT